MKSTQLPRSSSLFLLELIFSILFFSVASAVCVRVFVLAHTQSHDARALQEAVTLCSNAAEVSSASSSAAEALSSLAALYPAAEISGLDTNVSSNTEQAVYQLSLGFDGNLVSISTESSDQAPVYLWSVSLYESDGLLHCDAFMTKPGAETDSGEIYQLQTVHYLQGGQADE